MSLLNALGLPRPTTSLLSQNATTIRATVDTKIISESGEASNEVENAIGTETVVERTEKERSQVLDLKQID